MEGHSIGAIEVVNTFQYGSDVSAIGSSAKRLSRADWLRLALDALAEEGETELRIEKLTAHLGVTKGSFYWHFEDRADFVHRLAKYWAAEFTGQVGSYLESLDESASERLLALMRTVVGGELARYDILMRAWATHDDAVASIVRKVDRERLSTVRDLFAAIGFDGDELERRTRLFVTFVSFESGLSVPRSRRRRLEDLPALHALLTSTRMP